MTSIHIPAEVVEAAAKAIAKRLGCELAVFSQCTMGANCACALDAAVAVTAALAGWVECGMAKGGVAWKASIRDQHSWLADTDLPNPRGATFPVLILKTTEAT